MNTGAELITAHIEAENIAAKHLDFIKSRGERGRSAMADLSVFEELESTETNRYLTLRTEYFILRRLVQAMREELKRMEEKEN